MFLRLASASSPIASALPSPPSARTAEAENRGVDKARAGVDGDNLLWEGSAVTSCCHLLGEGEKEQ